MVGVILKVVAIILGLPGIIMMVLPIINQEWGYFFMEGVNYFVYALICYALGAIYKDIKDIKEKYKQP